MGKKQITGRLFVSIQGEDIPWEELPFERRNEIGAELTDRMIQALGYKCREERMGAISAAGSIIKSK